MKNLKNQKNEKTALQISLDLADKNIETIQALLDYSGAPEVVNNMFKALIHHNELAKAKMISSDTLSHLEFIENISNLQLN